MRNPKTLLRLLLFDIEARPPQAPVVMVTITAEPVKPRAAQTGLFIPLAPEPEKLEITLARLAKLVGLDNVGSPEVLDTHRPDAFRMNKFSLPSHAQEPLQIRNPQSAIRNRLWASECFGRRGVRRCKQNLENRRASVRAANNQPEKFEVW